VQSYVESYAKTCQKKEANEGYARMNGEKKVYLFLASLDMFAYFIMIR
jgi:hypothetical protein